MVKKFDKVDVVIVGTGWSGGIPAAELTKKGYKVVALERGKEKTREDFVGSKDELRYNRRFGLMQDLTKETLTSRNEMDEVAKPVRNNSGLVVGTDTGGSSMHWNGITYRYYPYDFEIYSQTVEKYGQDKIPKDMTLQDWGITYDELEPYYDQFEKMAGISGEDNPLGPPRSDDYPNPPLKKNTQIRLFQKAATDLGYHPYMSPAGNLSQQYTNPDGETINACMYCSYCALYGCDFGAKSDPLVTVLETARKTGNFEIRNESYVTRVLHDGKKATGLQYTDIKTGEVCEQPADLVIVAGFAFTNNRLLLLSEIGEPYNPETRKGVIGKNMAGHDNNMDIINVTGFFEDKKFNSYAGAGSLQTCYADYCADNFDHKDLDFIHGLDIETTSAGQRPITANPVPKGTPTWGKEFKDKSLHYTSRHMVVRLQKASLPSYHNYYDLDPTYKDVFGDPLLRVTRKYTDQDRKLSEFGVTKGLELMEKMEADIIEPANVPDNFPHTYTSGHYGGGVIMGADRETSAVNNYSQMWDMENLFVVGGSAFPHFSNYNPTGTIGALAYRAAEGMDKYLKGEGGLLVDAATGKATV